jgi:MATE family multidrug resistance protein
LTAQSSTPVSSLQSIDISYRRILRVTSPVLLTSLSYTAMGAIDTMMVGRLGLLELGAVGLGNLLSWWFLSFFYGLATGVNTFVAQAYGAGDGRRVGQVFWHGIYLALIAAVPIFLAVPFAPTVFGWTGADAQLVALALDYAMPRLIGAVGITLLWSVDNFYRGLGRTDMPMFCAFGQLLLNCGLNYLLIFGHFGFPAMGVRGAAIGTILAQGAVAAMLIWSILGSRSIRRDFHLPSTFVFAPRLMRQLLAVSVPVAVQVFMEMGGISVFSAVVARLGATQMAATNAVIQAWSLAFMGAMALSVGATTMVGQCLGADRRDEVRRAVGRVMRLGWAFMGVTAALYLGLPEFLMGLFVTSADVGSLIPYARPLFTIVVVCLVFDLRFNVVAGALRGAGDTTYAMCTNVGSAWLVFVPLTLWAAPRYGLIGAWWCLVAHVALMTLLLELRYRGSGWMRRLVDDPGSDTPSGLPGRAPELAAVEPAVETRDVEVRRVS